MYGRINTGELQGSIDRMNWGAVVWQIVLLLVVPVAILTPVVHNLLSLAGLNFLQPELFYGIWWAGMIWSSLFLLCKKSATK